MQKMMNTPLFISLACFLFLSSAAAQTPVLDSYGEKLVTGVQYYISSFIWGAGGGDLSLGNGTCPLRIIQLRSDVNPGIPVTFHRARGADTQTINIGANLDVKFASDLCDGSTVWTIGLDPWSRRPAIMTGGVLGSERDPDNWFQIQPHERSYKLAYCWACEMCKMAPQCADLTIVPSGPYMSLAVATSSDDTPFGVMFRKANIANVGAAIAMS